MVERGIGRGLAAILPSTRQDGDTLHDLPVELIRPNPRQPRTSLTDDGVRELADSIKAHGVIQPVLVRPLAGSGYELIAGERRWRAARLAGLERIPALVRSAEAAHQLELALIENMAREDLNPVEQARACAALVEELGLTREDVGLRVGRSRVAVSNLLRLLELPDEALALLEAGELSEGHGRALLLAADNGDRRTLARSAAAEGWSVRETESRARGGRAPGARRRKRGAVVMHPDQQAALDALADEFAAALGTDVRVNPRGAGCRVELSFDTLEQARELLDEVRRRRAA